MTISESSLKETNTGGGGKITQSPIDNNMNNSIANNNNNNGNTTSSREELSTNYEVGKTETKLISAPGEVKRITASVVVDGNLDGITEENIRNLVSNAIGYKADRGDEISVVGMTFDSTVKDNTRKQAEDMEKQVEKENKYKQYKIIGIILGVLLAIIIIIIILKKLKEDKLDDNLSELQLDMNSEINPKEKVEFDPIEFEVNTESNHIEKEIKKYASEKPNQVIDIVKSWIAEDER